MAYNPVFPARLKQGEALEKWGEASVFALLMGMRTGKTYVVLTKFGILEDQEECDDLLIIAPGGCYDVWLDEAKKHLDPQLYERMNIFLWKSAPGAPYERAMKAFLADRSRPRMFVVNVEALSRTKLAQQSVIDFLSAPGRKCMAAIDESVVIANLDSKRTKWILKEVKTRADYRVIMSGLATPRDPTQIFSQFFFLDWNIIGYKSFVSFKSYFTETEPEWIHRGGRLVQLNIVKGYKNLDELHNLIEPASFRCTLEDCYDVIEPEWRMRKVHMTGEQERIYTEMRDFMIAQLEDEAVISSTAVIAAMTRLHQICCGHVPDDDGNMHEIPENKTKEMLEFLADYEGKGIIWVSYGHDVQRVTEVLKKEYGEKSVAQFWGGNRNTREEEEHRFKFFPECRWMVATPDAGGRGRDWSIANLVFYYSCRNNLDHRRQSEERPNMVDKPDQVLYCDLVTPGTVEERIVYALREKIDLAAVINGDNWRSWLV